MRLAQFVATPESRSALHAVRRVAAAVRAGKPLPEAMPLILHGPPGSGKSHLAAGLLAVVAESTPPRTARLIAAADLANDDWQGALACDLLIVEDLQRLPARSAEAFANLLEGRWSQRRPSVLTASAGPALLPALPRRLTSRLGAGLVVGLERPGLSSRKYLLGRFAERQRVPMAPGVLEWIAAESPGGVRSLLGALTILKSISAGRAAPPNLETVQSQWALLSPPTSTPDVGSIKRGVAAYFGLTVRSLNTRKRHVRTLWPLQVAMYLAREQAGLTWDQIGAEFGGRDPSTVRHAFKKVSERLESDPAAATAVRHLQRELA